MTKNKIKPKIFLLDVDGVMTSGQFFYSNQGKVMKAFGPDDHDALSLLTPFLEIKFLTGVKKGFKITHKRIVNDMKFPLKLVSTVKRLDWIQNNYSPNEVIYMGDGIFDQYVFRKIGYAIAPSNADPLAKKYADYVTKHSGGDREVEEACIHI